VGLVVLFLGGLLANVLVDEDLGVAAVGVLACREIQKRQKEGYVSLK